MNARAVNAEVCSTVLGPPSRRDVHSSLSALGGQGQVLGGVVPTIPSL